MRSKLTGIGVAVFLLAVAVAAALYFQPWSGDGTGAATKSRPEAVRTFRGPEADPLRRPVGILVSEGRVYVADAQRGVIDEFSPGGHHYRTWGGGVLRAPVSIARNTRTGDFYVADRGLEALLIFDKEGTPKGRFAPKIPSAASWSSSPTALWSPIGLGFAKDGSLFVTDARTRHRLLSFDAAGRFVGEAHPGPAGQLAFPSAVQVRGDEVWVADSNNQRLLVFDLAGAFRRTIATQGLPRGFTFAPGEQGAGVVLVVDTLAHRIGEWNAVTGAPRGGFGERGLGDEQFSYPNAISAGDDDLVFIADTGNARVAVWSWTGRTELLGRDPLQWALLLVPFVPLLAVPFVLRKPRYFVTADFVRALWEADLIEELTAPRARWECLPEDRGQLRLLEDEGGPLLPMLQPVTGSESDARALRERYPMSHREAAVLSAARGALVLTEDVELLQMARAVGVEADDHVGFLERVSSGRADGHGAEEGISD